MADILVVEKLAKRFGNLAAVYNLSFNVEEGEILGMMGPNGAGKTTIFNLITGIYPPSEGNMSPTKAKISPISRPQTDVDWASDGHIKFLVPLRT